MKISIDLKNISTAAERMKKIASAILPLVARVKAEEGNWVTSRSFTGDDGTRSTIWCINQSIGTNE